MKINWTTLSILSLAIALPAFAYQEDSEKKNEEDSKCAGLPSVSDLTQKLVASGATENQANSGPIGGLFNGARMWAAVVNRNGELCAVTTSTMDPAQVWPGSQAIAKSKAYTANAFSLDTLALSTARLYTFTQPGHSLWSLGQSNLTGDLNLNSPGDASSGKGKISGGLIFFGGGVPLYKNGRIIGGLGISGDTSCADHEVAKRTRNGLGLNPPGGMLIDDIIYAPPDGASAFAHPKCPNTWRNSIFVGQETAVTYP